MKLKKIYMKNQWQLIMRLKMKKKQLKKIQKKKIQQKNKRNTKKRIIQFLKKAQMNYLKC